MNQTSHHSKMKTSKIPWKPFPHDDPSKVGTDELLIRVVVDCEVEWYEAEIVFYESLGGFEDGDPPSGWFALFDGPLIPISNITHYCIPSTEVDDE